MLWNWLLLLCFFLPDSKLCTFPDEIPANILREIHTSHWLSFILTNILYLAWRHTCFQTECNWDRARFIAEKIQDKHSISPLGDMQLYLQRKWKDNLFGCDSAGSNLIIFPSYCELEFDPLIAYCKQTLDLLSLKWNKKCGKNYMQTKNYLNCRTKKKNIQLKGIVWFFLWAVKTQRSKIYFILSWPRRGFITVRLWGCQLGQWCMKLPPFIGTAFNQFLQGICPCFCGGGHSLQRSLYLLPPH